MSFLKNIKSIPDNVKLIDPEIPTVKIEDDNKIYIENYSFVRLFTDEQICVEFDEYMISVEGSNLSIEEMSLYALRIKGGISCITYLDKRKRG